MRVKRTLAILAIVLVALAGLGFIGLRIWLAYLGIDEPPPHDSDLLPAERKEVPQDENAYPLFVRAGRIMSDMLKEPLRVTESEDGDVPQTEGADDTEEKRTVWNVVHAVQYDEPVDMAEVKAVVEMCREPLALFDQGLERGRLQVPAWQGLEIPEKEHLGMFCLLIRLVKMQALCYRAAGRPNEAILRAVDIARYGRMLEEAGGDINDSIAGANIKSEIGLATLRDTLPAEGISAEALAQAAQRLSGTWESQETLAAAMRREYAFWSRIMDALTSGRLDPKTLKPRENGAPPPAWQYRPNQTRRWRAERYRASVTNMGKCLASMGWPERLVPPQADSAWLVTKGNLLGRSLVALTVPTLKRFARIKCACVTENRVTRTMLALRRFQLDRSRLPQDLETLIPTYLDEVPRSDFDGKPLRYDPKKRLIYSVGMDFTDDGGMTEVEMTAWQEEEEGSFWDLPDPSWPIEF